MIERCRQILGEDPSSLYGGPPQRLNADDMGSGRETAEVGQLSLNTDVICLFPGCLDQEGQIRRMGQKYCLILQEKFVFGIKQDITAKTQD